MGRESGEASVARNERGGRDLFRGRAETLLAEARAINATSDGETHENERAGAEGPQQLAGGSGAEEART